MNSASVWFFYLAAAVGLAFCTAKIAKRKGYDPTAAALITAILSVLSFTIGGIIVLVVYACLRVKYNHCPRCGQPVIFYLPRCPQCDIPVR